MSESIVVTAKWYIIHNLFVCIRLCVHGNELMPFNVYCVWPLNFPVVEELENENM